MLTVRPEIEDPMPGNVDFGRCSNCGVIGDFGPNVEHVYQAGRRAPAKSLLTPCPTCKDHATLLPIDSLLRLICEG